MMRNLLYWLVLSLSLIGLNARADGPEPAAAGPDVTRWTIVELGTLGGRTSRGYAINAAGTVVGQSELKRSTTGDVAHAFLYRAGSMADLGVLAATTGNSIAFDINSAGIATGSSSSTRFASGEVVIWRDGQISGLGIEGAGFGINAAGTIVGQSNNHAFIYESGSFLDLGTFGGTQSQAYAINNSGQVVGSALTAGNALHAFLYDHGAMIDLGTLGGDSSAAYDINAAGQIVGTADGTAFVYRDGSMTALALPLGPSIATAINNRGDIVGVMGGTSSFLIRDGQLIELNKLPAVISAGWQSLSPQDISESGLITGTGVNAEGFQRAFILGPCGPATKNGAC